MSITTETTSILAADEWTPRWAACTNSMQDPYGNAVTIHETDETVRIEFEYALPGVVEVLHLNPRHGAHRIAAVIIALAAPDE
jgi:hypothetical protein